MIRRYVRSRFDSVVDDRGAVAIFVVFVGVVLLLGIGIVVDGGGKTRAIQKADNAAAEAARAGGQMIIETGAMRGGAARLDTAKAIRAAQGYLAAAGVTGTATVTGPNAITVTATATYEPVFLNIIGMKTQTGTGTATTNGVRICIPDAGTQEENCA